MDQPAWMEHAWSEVGQCETPGPAANARISGYYREAGHGEVTGDEVPWCAAFVGACLARAGQQPSGSLMARSYLSWANLLAQPRLGAIAVLARGSDPAQGHVGFVVGWSGDQIFLLGGNQGDAVNVSAFPMTRLVGLRWPDPTPATAPPASEPSPGAATFELFDLALDHVLEMEGGYTDDPYDPGGPTNRGITLAVYADHLGRSVEAGTIGALKAALRQISDGEVREIYRQRYWAPSRADDLPPALAVMHFDAAVNHGVTGAARLLQEAVATRIDGAIGPLTLRAAAAMPTQSALLSYAAARRRRYRALPHFWRFGRGWLARVDHTLARAGTLLTGQSPISSTTTPKGAIMPQDQVDPTVPQFPDSKWWGHSMTIWGAIVTTLSTVLPTLGPLIGLDLTADLIRQLGDQAVRAVEAAGGLIGILLTIYGRTRATTRIERRPMRLQV